MGCRQDVVLCVCTVRAERGSAPAVERATRAKGGKALRGVAARRVICAPAGIYECEFALCTSAAAPAAKEKEVAETPAAPRGPFGRGGLWSSETQPAPEERGRARPPQAPTEAKGSPNQAEVCNLQACAKAQRFAVCPGGGTTKTSGRGCLFSTRAPPPWRKT